MEVSGQLHYPDTLSPGKEPLVPTGLEAGGVGCRASLDMMSKRKNSQHLLGIKFHSSMFDIATSPLTFYIKP
jgi:hypothetical protein